ARRGRSSASKSVRFRTYPPCSNFTVRRGGTPIFVTRSSHFRRARTRSCSPSIHLHGCRAPCTRIVTAFHAARPMLVGLGAAYATLKATPSGSQVFWMECAMPETVLKIDTGDTAWVLTSAALVMLMTPALGFFYGGLVRRKNVLSTIMHSFFILCLISVQWVLWGYSLAFGPDIGGIIGGLDWIGLNGVGGEPNGDYAKTIPHQAYMVFQMMFAVITPALITGAFAERKRFKAFVIFTLLWATFVYDPVAHWVWGSGGWLKNMGALDFAGGTVVHITSGVSALGAAIVLGPRVGLGEEPMDPHDLTMTVLGAALLWFGWFGFNAGSALAAGELSTNAFVVTNTAAAMAALTLMTVSWAHHGR